MKNNFFLAIIISVLTACAPVSRQQIPDTNKADVAVHVTQNSPVPKRNLVQPGSSAAGNNAGSSDDKLAHARSLINEKQFEAAREELNALLKDHPHDPHIVFWLAKVSMHQDRRAEGEAYFERYHYLARGKEGYKPGQMLLVLARLCRERDDIEASRKWLDQIDPNDTDAFFPAQIQRSMLLAKEGNLAGALALVDSLEPKTSDDLLQVILSKGEYLRQSGRYEEAFEVLTTGASHVAPEPELFNLYASVANQIGRYDAAENATRAVIAIAPGDSRAYNNLSFWLAERNIRLEEALLLASKALEIAPDDAYVMDTMGYVQYRLGNFNAAEVYLRRSNSLLQRPEVALHLAEVLLQKGEREEAQKLLREASVKAESTVNNDQLRHKIERLQLSL